LYLGTELGFYISFNGGDDWQKFRLNLPVTPVHDIAVAQDDLVIATHGRGFYVLDHIGALRQLSTTITESSVFLFQPSNAVRSVSRAVVDYYLAAADPGLKLDILDSGGQVIRAFTAGSGGSQEAGSEDGPPPPIRTVPAQNGMNRFTWDTRAAPSHDFPGLIMYQVSVNGPLVPPGRFQVRLTAAGKSLTQEFTVAKDPRLTTVSDTDLAEQYRFAREIQDKFSQTNEAVTRIRRIKARVAERIEQAKNGPVTAAGNKLTASLTGIEGLLYQYRNQATKDPLNFPPQLNNKLGSLLGVIESADARPTDSSYIVYKELAAKVDRELAELADLLGRDLTAFNNAVSAAHLSPVSGN
jgi:hypothetical protein